MRFGGPQDGPSDQLLIGPDSPSDGPLTFGVPRDELQNELSIGPDGPRDRPSRFGGPQDEPIDRLHDGLPMGPDGPHDGPPRPSGLQSGIKSLMGLRTDGHARGPRPSGGSLEEPLGGARRPPPRLGEMVRPDANVRPNPGRFEGLRGPRFPGPGPTRGGWMAAPSFDPAVGPMDIDNDGPPGVERDHVPSLLDLPPPRRPPPRTSHQMHMEMGGGEAPMDIE